MWTHIGPSDDARAPIQRQAKHLGMAGPRVPTAPHQVQIGKVPVPLLRGTRPIVGLKVQPQPPLLHPDHAPIPPLRHGAGEHQVIVLKPKGGRGFRIHGERSQRPVDLWVAEPALARLARPSTVHVLLRLAELARMPHQDRAKLGVPVAEFEQLVVGLEESGGKGVRHVAEQVGPGTCMAVGEGGPLGDHGMEVWDEEKALEEGGVAVV